MAIRSITEFLLQFKFTLQSFRTAVSFIKAHKLWKGFGKYGWFIRFVIFIAFVVWVKFFTIALDWWKHTDTSDPVNALYSMGSMVQSFTTEGYQLFFIGGMKYVMLILLEVVIFHFSRVTFQVLNNTEVKSDFEVFVKAQIRMIKVAFASWVLETLFSIGLDLMFKISIIGYLSFLKPALLFLIQCFFLGFAMIDNYFEQFDLDIKESLKASQYFLGVAVASGLVLYLFLLVPVVGTILGPILTAVTVTLVLYRLSDIHLNPPKKEEEPELATE